MKIYWFNYKFINCVGRLFITYQQVCCKSLFLYTLWLFITSYLKPPIDFKTHNFNYTHTHTKDIVMFDNNSNNKVIKKFLVIIIKFNSFSVCMSRGIHFKNSSIMFYVYNFYLNEKNELKLWKIRLYTITIKAYKFLRTPLSWNCVQANRI